MDINSEYNYILPNILKILFEVKDYSTIMKDNSIKGKFKFLLNYKPDSHNCTGSILIHYLLQFVDPTNTMFDYSKYSKMYKTHNLKLKTKKLSLMIHR